MMLYFLDTEFIEQPNTIDLISIGIVSEDGREYSAISSEYDSSKADDWVINNVLTPMYKAYIETPEELSSEKESSESAEEITVLNFHRYAGKPIEEIKQDILNFVGFPDYDNGKPEFWGYYADYDWVVFCWIFGKMIDLPEGFPMYCKDLKQVLDHTNIDKLPDPEGEHNALVDARWNRDMYDKIEQSITDIDIIVKEQRKRNKKKKRDRLIPCPKRNNEKNK